MSSTNLSDILGVQMKSMQWERLFLFFAALFISSLYSLVLSPSISHSSLTGYSLDILDVQPSWFWLRAILSNLILVGSIIIAFRITSNTAIAVIITALIYSILSAPISIYLLKMGAMRIMESTTSIDWNWKSSIASTIESKIKFIIIFLGSLAFVLQYIKPTWFALFAGVLVSKLLKMSIIQEDGAKILLILLFTILETIIFAAVLWIGLWLTSFKPSATITDKPRFNKGFYQGTLAVAFGCPLILNGAISILFNLKIWDQRDVVPILLLMTLATLFIILGTVIFSLLIYKMWASIQDGHERTTPGRAIGFLFIPFFNLFWIFQTFVGFANDFNSFIKRYSLNIHQLKLGLFLTFTFLIIALIILSPIVGIILILFPNANPLIATIPYVIPIITYVITLTMISKICEAVNMIPEIKN